MAPRSATAWPSPTRNGSRPSSSKYGNAYDEGLDNDFWKPLKAYWKEPKSREKRDALRAFLTYDATRWQYTNGVKRTELISPDGPAHDQFLLGRAGNDEIQLDLFLSYGSNPLLYPKWQAYFREHQPPVLIVWGKNDQVFPAAGAEPYKRDLRTSNTTSSTPRTSPWRPTGRDRRADAGLPGEAPDRPVIGHPAAA